MKGLHVCLFLLLLVPSEVMKGLAQPNRRTMG